MENKFTPSQNLELQKDSITPSPSVNKNHSKKKQLTLLFILLILVIGGLYFYFKNTKIQSVNISVDNKISKDVAATSTVVRENISNYIFSDILPKNLKKVQLSHHSIKIESPWGLEKSYKGSPNKDSLGQYTFSNGIKMLVTVNKLSPKDNIKQLELSIDERKEYDSFLKFIDSKIGSDYSGYDYIKFIGETNQQTVDSAIDPKDKEGYSKVLFMKGVLGLQSPIHILYQFTNQDGKGFVYIGKSDNSLSSVDFWGKNGWRYTFMFPAKQNIIKADVDSLIKSIESF